MTAPDPRVGEIEARLAAVPEVWDCDGFSDGNITHLSLYEGTNQGRMIASDITSHEDADFLRYARSDIAYLLAELRDRDEKLARATVLIGDLIDRDDCSFDHHGGCQAHGYLSLEPGETCPQRDAKEWVHAAVAAANGTEDAHD